MTSKTILVSKSWLWCLTIALLLFCGAAFQTKTTRPFGTRAMSDKMVASVGISEATPTGINKGSLPRKLLIHWKGEKDVGYSKPFRHLEFKSALAAELNIGQEDQLDIQFISALNYTGEERLPDGRIEHYNEAMQYISLPEGDTIVTRDGVIAAVQRCSLVHALYEVISVGDDWKTLCARAMDDGGFQDLYQGGIHEKDSWCFRVRNFEHLDLGNNDDPNVSAKEKRYGSNARSMKLEKQGLDALKELMILFGGKVDLRDPDCKIYAFDGLLHAQKALSRRIAVSPKTSIINPNTRICVTNTPLEPIAAFSLVNIGRVQAGSSILDPYAGSCATLLAAAMIAPRCQTVGVEISHNGMVNRDDILKDFSTRTLPLPKDLIKGDSTNLDIRNQARAAIGNQPFDTIVADPPYGIRETIGHNEMSPLDEMFTYIGKDRDAGTRLLKKGGRLVVFVPVTDEESLSQLLPSAELSHQAGLKFEVSKEQVLNEKLSRWLVAFVCVR